MAQSYAMKAGPLASVDAHPRIAIVVRDGAELVSAAFHEHQLDVATDLDDVLARFVSLCRRRRQPEAQSQRHRAEAHPAKQQGVSLLANRICGTMAPGTGVGKSADDG
jgi:hypothetical protein